MTRKCVGTPPLLLQPSVAKPSEERVPVAVRAGMLGRRRGRVR